MAVAALAGRPRRFGAAAATVVALAGRPRRFGAASAALATLLALAFSFFAAALALACSLPACVFYFSGIGFAAGFTPFSSKGSNGFGQIRFRFGRQFGFKRSNRFLSFRRNGFCFGFNLCRFGGYFSSAYCGFQCLQFFFLCA